MSDRDIIELGMADMEGCDPEVITAIFNVLERNEQLEACLRDLWESLPEDYGKFGANICREFMLDHPEHRELIERIKDDR